MTGCRFCPAPLQGDLLLTGPVHDRFAALFRLCIAYFLYGESIHVSRPKSSDMVLH